MNIIDLLNKPEPLEGEFTLPSGEKVKGCILLDPQYDYTILLRVFTSQEQRSHPPDLEKAIIHGKLNDEMYLTLIGSTPTRSKYIPRLPNYVIYCQSVLTAHTHQIARIDCCEVTKIRFKLPHSRQIFPISMKCVRPENRREILKTIMREGYRLNDQDHSFDRVYYCSGGTEVVSCDTGYGRFSVRPYDVTTLPYIDVEFTIEPVTDAGLSHAESAIECVTRFFWLITGIRQYAEDIRLDVRDPEDGNTHELNVHFLLQEASLFTKDSSTHSISNCLLINPFDPRQSIEKCFKCWVSLSKDQRNACDIILSQFTESSHQPYRIARAAVAYERFGELSEARKKKTNLDSKKKKIIDFANEQIKRKFPCSEERDYILSEMGGIARRSTLKEKIIKFANKQIKDKFPCSEERNYILSEMGGIARRSTLKNKIKSRIDIIRGHLPDEMKNIEKVAFQAVDARNEYIHGNSIPKQHGPTHIFYACTLEFIFLASVLVECGWDMKSWTKSPNTLEHPFDRYIADYSQLYDMCVEEAV